MRTEILKWLSSGCDPIVGLGLQEKYSKNKMLIRIVRIDPGQNLSIIIKELSKLAEIDTGTGNGTGKQEGTKPGKSVSFRDEFPFLSSPHCPIELKALVTDKFSSYYLYKELHSKLTGCNNTKECADLSRDIIDSYIENRCIYAELDYYKKNGVILGKHPIFSHFRKMEDLRKLSIKDLVLKQQMLEHNIWRIESELKKNDKPHLVAERNLRLQEKKQQLSEVIRLLG
jgi:hypothetical protein